MAVTTRRQPGLEGARFANPSSQAYWLLRVGFSLAPILFGLDKFFHVMVDWDRYLAGPVDDVVPGSAHTAMLVVGGIEIIAGLVTAVLPRVGGYVVAAWLLTIVANLLIKAEYYDVALRDFGLALGALSLARLATGFRGLRGEREHPQQSAGRRRRSGADHGPPGGVEVVGANGDQPQGGDWASKERPARGRERRR